MRISNFKDNSHKIETGKIFIFLGWLKQESLYVTYLAKNALCGGHTDKII